METTTEQTKTELLSEFAKNVHTFIYKVRRKDFLFLTFWFFEGIKFYNIHLS